MKKTKLEKRIRPAIPDRVKIRVAVRQLHAFKADVQETRRKKDETAKSHLTGLLALLAAFLKCDPKELHCDHNPPLRARPYNSKIKEIAARYSPNANDPEYLEFMSKADHQLKTNVRGKGAQFPDRVLIKRQRRLEKRDEKKAARWKTGFNRERSARHSRPLISANRWPPKGSRPFRRKPP